MNPRTRLLSIRLSEKLARHPNLASQLGWVEIKEQVFVPREINTINKMNDLKKEKPL